MTTEPPCDRCLPDKSGDPVDISTINQLPCRHVTGELPSPYPTVHTDDVVDPYPTTGWGNSRYVIRLHDGKLSTEPVPLDGPPPWTDIPTIDAADACRTVTSVDGFTLYDSSDRYSAEHIYRVVDGKAVHWHTIQPSRWARLHWWLTWPARRWMR